MRKEVRVRKCDKCDKEIMCDAPASMSPFSGWIEVKILTDTVGITAGVDFCSKQCLRDSFLEEAGEAIEWVCDCMGCKETWMVKTPEEPPRSYCPKGGSTVFVATKREEFRGKEGT